MPLRRMAGPTTDTSVTPTNGPYLSYAIDGQLETSRPNRAGRTRSRTAILIGNTPLRPDYHRAACSGFAASAASAPPLKTSLRSSPPPRSTRLGSTIPLGRPDLCRPSPAPNARMDPTPAAPSVSNHYSGVRRLRRSRTTLEHFVKLQPPRLGSSSTRRPLCDATRRYMQLGRPDPPPRSLYDHLPSHTRPEIADITDLAAKCRLLEGDDDTILLVRKPITTVSVPSAHNSRRSRPPFDEPVRIYVPLLAMDHARIPRRCFLPPRCHKNTQNAGTFLLVIRYGSLHQMVVTTLPQVPGTENLSPSHSMV